MPALDHVLETHFNPLIRRMRASRLPVISQVNGPCAGAAVGVALAGDIVMAARSAYFYEPFVGIALVPDAGNTLFLSRLIGRIRAAPMMLLGDRIKADEALAWGLVWRVHDDPELGTEVDRIAAKLAALAPDAVAATKRLIAAATDFGMHEQLDLERDQQGIAGRTPEMKQALPHSLRGRDLRNCHGADAPGIRTTAKIRLGGHEADDRTEPDHDHPPSNAPRSPERSDGSVGCAAVFERESSGEPPGLNQSAANADQQRDQGERRDEPGVRRSQGR